MTMLVGVHSVDGVQFTSRVVWDDPVGQGWLEGERERKRDSTHCSSGGYRDTTRM